MKVPSFLTDVCNIHYWNSYPPFFYKRAFDERIDPHCGVPYTCVLSLPDANANIGFFKFVTRSLQARRGVATRTTPALLMSVEGEVEPVRCSEETPYVVPGGASRRAGELKPGDVLYNGAKVTGIENDGDIEVW